MDAAVQLSSVDTFCVSVLVELTGIFPFIIFPRKSFLMAYFLISDDVIDQRSLSS